MTELLLLKHIIHDDVDIAMTINMELKFALIHDLYLDPLHPRLRRHNIKQRLSQDELLNEMRTWTLDELAESYLENGGFWTHEALLVVKEKLYKETKPKLVVVEGNRRLAALKYLYKAHSGDRVPHKWQSMVARTPPPDELFSKIPYILVDSRQDVQAFLGFRHVTGIKQWGADEKAGFIAKLIEEQGLSYEQVMRKIGSQTPVVRKHYIAYRTLLQIENTVDDVVTDELGQRFAILYMSIDTEGAKQYLQIDIQADPEMAKTPVPATHLQNLTHFAHWLFGTQEAEPLIRDTRQVSDFGKILESQEATKYLEISSNPKLDVAYRIAGGDEVEIIRYVEEAANGIELALTRAHAFKESEKLQRAVHRFGGDVIQLLSIFPTIKKELLEEA